MGRALALCVCWLVFASCQGTVHVPWSLSRRAESSRQAVQAALEAAVTRVDPQLHWGMVVMGAEDGALLYEHNSLQRFIPASTLKLFTGAAALHYLGPSHRFTTTLWTDEVDRQGRAKNIYLKGSGDPRLDAGDLATMAALLKEQGITAVTGDLVVDDSIFDSVPLGKGWMWDDLGDGYSAPIGGVNVASNAITFGISPAARVGTPVRYMFTPPTAFFTLQNLGMTQAVGAPNTLRLALPASASAPDQPAVNAGQTVQISGVLPLDAKPVFRRLAIRDAAMWAGTLMREQLRAARIDVAGQVRRGVTPPDAVQWASHASGELGPALADFMKVSDNQAMEALIKRMGAMTTLTPGTWTNGVAAVRAFLDTVVGIETSTLIIADGSGNSRYTLVAPAQIAALLRFMHDSFALAPEFITSLPIGGTDGTLSGRMADPVLYNRVRAKTGSMTGVSNLAGYVETQDGETLIFVIMMDGFIGSADTYRRVQDEMLRILVAPA